MSTKTYLIPEGTDLYAFMQSTALTLSTQGYDSNIQMIGPYAGVLTVTKDREGITNLIGLGLECRANFSVIDGNLTVTVDGEWTNKIIAVAVGWFVCIIPVVTGIVGAISQLALPDKIFNAVNMSVTTAMHGGPYTPPTC